MQLVINRNPNYFCEYLKNNMNKSSIYNLQGYDNM